MFANSPKADLRRLLIEQVFGQTAQQDSDQSVDQVVAQIVSNVVELGKNVFSRDNRMTDNAWVEVRCAFSLRFIRLSCRSLFQTTAFSYYDATGELSNALDQHKAQVAWRTAHRHQRLFASHSLFLQKVVEAQHAAW